MNLVISGPIDVTLRNLVVGWSTPRRVVSLHAKADRLENVDDSAAVRTQVATLCDAARVDHAYIEEGVRFADFKLLAMDMDSTLITIECIDEIADFAGKRKEVAAITEAAMRGEIPDFAESLRQRVSLLAGTSETILTKVKNERLYLVQGATELIRNAQSARIYTLLLSGGFTYFSDHVRAMLKLDAAFANKLEIKNGLLTGRLEGVIIDHLQKAKLVQQFMKDISCKPDQTIIVGDGANDIEMMKYARHSVAFHAKPITQQFATTAINYGTLSTIIDYFS